jgi:hypothetical protein
MPRQFLHYFMRDGDLNLTLVYNTNQSKDNRFVNYKNDNCKSWVTNKDGSLTQREIHVNMNLLNNVESEIERLEFQSSYLIMEMLRADKEQIFLLRYDGSRDNQYLHDFPHYILVNQNSRLFVSYHEALTYGNNSKTAFTVWQCYEEKPHLLYSNTTI